MTLPKHPSYHLISKVVKKYSVVPYIPRAERWRWEKEGTASARIKGYALYSAILYPVTGGSPIQYGSDVGVMSNITAQKIKNTTYNKDWRQKVARHQDASSDYLRQGGAVLKSITWHGVLNRPNKDVWVCRGAVAGQDNFNIIDTSQLESIALGRLKKRLSSTIGDASLLPPLAESREIHGLVRQVNGFAYDALHAILLIKKTKGKSVVKLAGKVWLFFNFGVNPLVSDIAKAADAILSYQERSDHPIKITGTASTDYSSTSNQDVLVADVNCTGHIVYQSNHKLSVRYVGGANLTVRSDASYSVADHLGLSVENLPSALWELTPYSWVVDYFTTVGPWLDDVFYTLPGSLVYLVKNIKYKCRTTSSMTFLPGNNTWSGGYSPGEIEVFHFTRTKLASLPHQSLRVRSFDEIGKFGLSKLLNLASVLVGNSPRFKVPVIVHPV